MPRAAQELRIAGGDAFAGALATLDPVFGLPSLPFVVQSVEMARSVNARARPLYEKALQAKGLKLLGPLPEQIQSMTAYCAGVMTEASEVEIARDFIQYLETPPAKAIFTAAGFEP